MKHIITLFILCMMAEVTSAQWSGDPANPAIVCDAANSQGSVRALYDGNGGYYVFWRDDRNSANTTEIYGQRYNANGVALWPTNGKLIYAQANRDVNFFHVIRNFQGNLFFGISQGLTNSGDTIVAYKTDSAGNALWAQPTVVAGRTSGVIYTSDVYMVEKDTGIYIGFFLIHTGGSEDIHMNRIDNDGNNLWGFNGITVPNSGYGGFGLYPDGVGGLFIYWRNGNGAGTGLGVRRMAENGTFLWAGNVNPASGTPGLGYDYSVTPDDNHGLIFTWVEQIGASIQMARIDSSGAMVWSPGVMPVCEASSNQDRCRVRKNGNYIYVAWSDNRPPASNSDIFMQKFDMNGVPQWTLDGIRCTSVNTYISYTNLSPGSNGSMMCTVNGNVSPDGFIVQKLNADSTFAWGSAGVKIANHTFNPASTDYKMLTSADSGTVVFWSSGGDIYTARVSSNGLMTGMSEASDKIQLVLYPNPANENVIIRHNTAASFTELIIADATGRIVLTSGWKQENGETEISTADLPAGFYTVSLKGQQTIATSKFMISR